MLSSQEGSLPSGESMVQEEVLIIDNIQKEDAGEYECTASNNAGTPDSSAIKVNVICK